MSDTNRINQELKALRDAGVVLPRNTGRAVDTAREMQKMAATPGSLQREVSALEKVHQWDSKKAQRSPELAAIERNNAILASEGRSSRSRIARRDKTATNDVAIAIPRFYDPLEYWDLSGLPWNMADEGHRHKLHKWMRLYYATHRLIPQMIDIFTRFPLIGLNIYSPDRALTEFYEDLFLGQLKYEEFLVRLGREVWTVGEAYPLGSFDADLGVWEHEELLNPEDIVIENFPLLSTSVIKCVPPEYLCRLATTKTPPKEYKQLQDNFPDLIPYLKRKEPFPIDDTLIKQVAFKITDWDDHGTPILLRGLRTLLHEEKLLASQDAIAERLYSPLILAKLGINNMGDKEGPWIPPPDQLESFRDDMDIALSSDFRLLVYHYALEIENVFGREQVPDLGNDFDRVDRWLMQIFGLEGIMGAGANAQPYATSALNAEFMNQMLKTYQNQLKEHTQARMEIVAEAQEHWDYEKKGQTRVPIFEEVVEVDEDGNKHIVKKHKLMTPELEFECVAYGTRIQTPSGPRAAELLREGDLVLSWDPDSDNIVAQPVTHSYRLRVGPGLRIQTRQGREISVTSNHPFLTPDGWSEAQDLGEGSKLRVATGYRPDIAPTISERDAYFLGLMVGDGCTTQIGKGVPGLANYDEEILSWTAQYVSGYGCKLAAAEDECTKDITQIDVEHKKMNPISAFLTEHGLAGCSSHTKRVPKEVWRGGPGVWSAFLSGYLDADGTVRSDHSVKWIAGTNRELLRDCQALLAMLGIRSHLRHYEYPEYETAVGTGFSAFWLIVRSRAGLESCQRWLEPRCKRKQIMCSRVGVVDLRRVLTPSQASEVKELVSQKKHRNDGPTYREIGTQFDCSPSTILRAIKGNYDEPIKAWVDPRWDEVESVQLVEDMPIWSLGVGWLHNHVSEDLITHNSLDLRDEATERAFLQSLRGMGVPISDERLMVGVNFEYKDSLDEMQEEMIMKTVAQQMAKLQVYKILKARGLPVPPGVQAEIAGGAPPPGGPGGPGGMGGGAPGGMGGMPSPGGMGGGGGPAPGGHTIVAPPPPPGLGGGAVAGGPGGAPPYPAAPIGGGGMMPNISLERRTNVNEIDIIVVDDDGQEVKRQPMSFAAHSVMKIAHATEHEAAELDLMTEEQIDNAIEYYKQTKVELQFRRRMSMTANEYRKSNVHSSEDIMKLSVATDEEIVIDKVPPAFRRLVASQALEVEAEELDDSPLAEDAQESS